MIFISPFELPTITPSVQEYTFVLFGAVVSLSILNVVGTMDMVAPEFTQTSPAAFPASSEKRFGDAQFTCLPGRFGLQVLNSLWGVIYLSGSTLADAILILQSSMQVIHEVHDRSLLKFSLVVTFLTSSSSLQNFQFPDPGHM